MTVTNYDIIVIGSGMGGGVLTYALKDTGMKILLVERGDFLPQEPDNWNPEAVFAHRRYKPHEVWYDEAGKPFSPGVHYFVGGNTKVYGAALPRFRKEDFSELEHEEGISPEWPITYEDLEPYYQRAEELFAVHGSTGVDPTDPPRKSAFPFPPVPHEPYIEDLKEKLERQGLHPSFLPTGIDLREGGRCIRCKTCDGFPCQLHAKSEADLCCVRPAPCSENVKLLTRTLARRLLASPNGKKIETVEIEQCGSIKQIRGDIFVVSCGAVNSSALLLRSASSSHPQGLANSSGLVGRNYMMHNNSFLMAIAPFRLNETTFQKTMAVNDYYLHGPEGWKYPLGHLQLLGKLQAGMLTANKPFVPRPVLKTLANRSVDWLVMSEDLPKGENRVTVSSSGQICVHWKPTNKQAHLRLIKLAKEMLRRSGYPVVLAQTAGIETNSHQCGTAPFGADPRKSVLDTFCRSYDIENLYVVDSSFFPSSAACNPALTIAAQALRVAEHLASE